MKQQKEPSKKIPLFEQSRHLKQYLQVSGLKTSASKVIVGLIIASVLISITIIVLVGRLHTDNMGFLISFSIFMLFLGSVLIFFLLWVMFLVFLDYLKFKRKIAMEDILPEFLKLVAANHRAGYSLEMSLWKANRPRFGILSEEINEVAKLTYTYGDLAAPLKKFATKYDSSLLTRVVSNVLEGLNTGADIADLLDDVSNNIITIKNTRKELASEVENYMLFISVTVLIISPLMFGLTYKLTGLVETVKESLAETLSGGDGLASSPISNISFEKSQRDFKSLYNVFVFLMIATNSIISVLLMSIVKYGNLKQNLKSIPLYFIVGSTVYIVCRELFSALFVSL